MILKLSSIFDEFKSKLIKLFWWNFGFVVESLTVVGYGDNHNIYDSEQEKHPIMDMIILCILILSGTVSFSKMAGGMRSIFSANQQEISFDQKIMMIEQQLQLYFLAHNSTIWTKRLCYKNLEEFMV